MIASKKNKILRNKLKKESKDFHTENYKTLLKLKKTQINGKASVCTGWNTKYC